MNITAADLRRLAPTASNLIVRGIVDHQSALPKYGVDTPRRLRHFMAQIAHESDGLRTTREYASGEAYEGRRDLGNVVPGDGKRYRGRGLIQITGRANARAVGRALNEDYEAKPQLMEVFPGALFVSLWYWQARLINAAADADDIKRVTLAINGGLNGLADRKSYLAKAKAIWPDVQPVASEPIGPSPSLCDLRVGSTGPVVSAWQRELQQEGFAVKVDGDFGTDTRAVTRKLQADLGLYADGVVGAATRAALAARRARSSPASLSPSAAMPLLTQGSTMTSSASAAVTAAVIKAVVATVARPEVDAAPSAAGAITAAVTDAVAPIVAHATNSEPWYQSRVTWGALVSMAVPILGAVGVSTDWLDPDTAAFVLTAAGTAIGGVLTLYGRWKAKRPIGT